MVILCNGEHDPACSNNASCMQEAQEIESRAFISWHQVCWLVLSHFELVKKNIYIKFRFFSANRLCSLPFIFFINGNYLPLGS